MFMIIVSVSYISPEIACLILVFFFVSGEFGSVCVPRFDLLNITNHCRR